MTVSIANLRVSTLKMVRNYCIAKYNIFRLWQTFNGPSGHFFTIQNIYDNSSPVQNTKFVMFLLPCDSIWHSEKISNIVWCGNKSRSYSFKWIFHLQNNFFRVSAKKFLNMALWQNHSATLHGMTAREFPIKFKASNGLIYKIQNLPCFC